MTRELAEATSRPLYKTTIVIWTSYEFHAELEDLAREATSGDAYCSTFTTVKVDTPATDPAWDGTEFFDDTDYLAHE